MKVKIRAVFMNNKKIIALQNERPGEASLEGLKHRCSA